MLALTSTASFSPATPPNQAGRAGNGIADPKFLGKLENRLNISWKCAKSTQDFLESTQNSLESTRL
jgi:hypothetical protein